MHYKPHAAVLLGPVLGIMAQKQRWTKLLLKVLAMKH
jgi:hypothetical protein